LKLLKTYIDSDKSFSNKQISATDKNIIEASDIKIRTKTKELIDVWKKSEYVGKGEAGWNIISWGTKLFCMGATLYISAKYYNSAVNFFSYEPFIATGATLYGAFSVYKCKEYYDKWRMGSIAVQKMETGIEETGLGKSIKTLEDELKQSKEQ
jgi:hypothetical protein